MKRKLCYHELIKQLQEKPELSPGETLSDLRAWIDNIVKEYGNKPLGLLQAYAYVLTINEKWQGKEKNEKN